jgi:hypothetical protein
MTKWSVIDRRRGLKRVARKRSWLRWLCNPMVWKAITTVAQAVIELARIFQKH